LGDVAGPYVGFGPLEGEGEGDAAGAGTDVGGAGFLLVRQFFEGQVDEQFRFGAGDEDTRVNDEGALIKLLGAGKVLRRLPLHPPLNEQAIVAKLARLQRPLIFQIERDALAPQHMREQKLRRQPRRIHVAFLKLL